MTISLALIAIFAVCGLILVGLSSQLPSQENQRQDQQQPATQHKAPGSEEAANAQHKSSGWARIKEAIERNEKVVGAISAAIVGAFTAALFFATAYLYFSSEKVADAAKDSAKAAQDSADVSRDALFAANRPWVSGKIEIAGPMTFDAKGGGAKIALRYTLAKSGPSPALNVQFAPKIILNTMREWKLPTDGGVPIHPVRGELKTLCSNLKDGVEKQWKMGKGELFFPGDPLFTEQKITQIFEMEISPEEISKALEENEALWKPLKPGDRPATKFLIPAIIACVTYTSDITKSVHQTGMLFHFFRTDPSRPKERLGIEPSGGNIPVENLHIEPWFFGGGFAT